VASAVHDCPVLRLDRPLEDVRRDYAPALRRALRRAGREGVTVAVERDLSAVRPAYPHYVARMREIGAAVKPWRFVEGLVRRELAVPFVARLHGGVAGFLVLLPTPSVAIYWISAQDPRAASVRPMPAMLDAAVEWAHARGIALFSLGESHGRPGLIRFKQGFGPERAESVVVVRTYRPALQRAWRTVEPMARLAYGTWERLRARDGRAVPPETRIRAASSGAFAGGPEVAAPPAPEVLDLAQALPGARVLATGATGFIGQHVVHALLRAPDLRVRGLVRSRERATEVLGAAAGEIELAIGDLAAADGVHGLCRGVDVVVHAASAVPYALSAKDPSTIFHEVNVEGTAALAREAARAGVRRFVLLSSTGAMGTPAERVVDETSPCLPTTPYARSKLAAEQRLLEIGGETGIEIAIVRPCLVAGPGKRGGELLKLLRLCRRGLFPVIRGGLEVEKPLVDVADVVQALLRAVVRARAGETYLVHSDGGHTLGDILRAAGELVGNPAPWISIPLPAARAAALATSAVCRVLGRRPPLTPERLDLFLAHRSIVIRKAREELGYEPRHRDAREMLARTHEWYVRSGQL
jgi:nucleoside-diphosphate-sugar epimerase